MAFSAAAAAKIAATVLSNESLRKGVGWIIAAVLSPLILIIVLICCLVSGTADHNNTAVDLSFNGGVISGNIPEEYRGHIEDIRGSFALLDGAIATVSADLPDGESLDSIRIKAIFFALYFGAESPSLIDHLRFAGCFVETEDGTSKAAALPTVYENIAAVMGGSIGYEDQANASEIYYRVLYGKPAPTYGQEFDEWSNGLPLSSAPFIGADGFCSPLGEGWRSMVTSEFGYRKDPFTGQTKGHGGLDLGAGKGTSIRAVLPGTVYVVRYSTSGYGYHVMVDHGGGFVTLYAHCSKILVTEGQAVDAGAVIAEVGSTGRSTGNHLHFEVRIGGEKQNPRSYLP